MGTGTSVGREDFGRVVGEREDDGRSVFFELLKEMLVAEMDAVERADCEGNGGGKSGDVIKGLVDDHK